MKPKSCTVCGTCFQPWWKFCPECGDAIEDFDYGRLPTAEDVRGILSDEKQD